MRDGRKKMNLGVSPPTSCLVTSGHDACDDRIFYKEAVSLREAGYNVVIIAPARNVPAETRGVRFFGYRRISRTRAFGLGRLFQSAVIVWLGLKANADVYHCHEPGLLFPAILIRLGQRILRRKRVFIVHEIRDFYLQEAYLDHNPRRWQGFRLALREGWDRLLQWRCDHIVGVEETKVAKPLSYGIPHERVSVIENYVRLELFHARAKPFDPNNFVVAYEGGLSYLRGIDRLAEACVTLAKRRGIRVTLLLAGRWVLEKEAQHLAHYCARNQQFVNLQFRGWLPHFAVSRILAQADVCCVVFFSKRYEKVLSGKAGPIKLYEYMACGKAIVASDLAALRYVLQKARCGTLVDVGAGANAIADAFDFYYSHPGCLAEHGNNGRRAVEQWFNWAICEKRLLDIYARLLSPETMRNGGLNGDSGQRKMWRL